MKKTLKQIISGVIIMGITLAAGFGISLLSFNLFKALTPNQMKLLFTFDVFLLSAAATAVWYFFDCKNAKNRRKKEFQKRRNSRIEKNQKQWQELSEIINLTNFAA